MDLSACTFFLFTIWFWGVLVSFFFFFRNDICQSVTHVAILNGDFPEVKHIVVDEAQNFRPEENWHHVPRS